MRLRPPAADCDHAAAAEPDVASTASAGVAASPSAPAAGGQPGAVHAVAAAAGALELAPDDDARVGGRHPGLRRVARPEARTGVQRRGRLPGGAVEAGAVDARPCSGALR